MKREIVLYRDARGKECICEAEEYDAVWASHPGIKLIERGMGTFEDKQPMSENLKGDYTGKVWPNTRVFQRPIDVPSRSCTVTVCGLPNMSTIVHAEPFGREKAMLWFHCSNSEARNFDKRYHFACDGKFGEEALGHVLDLTRPHSFVQHNNLWFIFPHVEAARPSFPVEPIPPTFVRKPGGP